MLFYVLCTDGMRPQDYTCAQYKPETFEMLAYKLTIEKLVTVFGYPSVRAWYIAMSKSKHISLMIWCLLAMHPLESQNTAHLQLV